MIRVAVALLLVVATAVADPEADADRAFKAATQLAASDVQQAIVQLEAIGAARPITRWTDDAWAEAGRLAERVRDYARARGAYEQAIAVNDEIANATSDTGAGSGGSGTGSSATGSAGNATGSSATSAGNATNQPLLRRDEALVRRARAALARLATTTGDGRWDAVKREHDRLVSRAHGETGDPRALLGELEALASANPEYPQAASVWLVVAQGWEREGDGERALEVLASVSPRDADRERIGFAHVRTAIRRGALEVAGARLDALAALPGADRYAIADLRDKLAIAQRRAWIRSAVWIVLAFVGVLTAAMLRREAGAWRPAGKALARPPIEVLFLLPIGAVLIAVAQTGNPLVARAVVAIVIAGLVVGWLSGALLELVRAKRPIGAPRAIAQALIAAAAIAAATYLAVDRDRMLDLVAETIEHGPAH